jgi:PncC family amidohydrolase
MESVSDQSQHDSTLIACSARLGGRLRTLNWTCATAESCTGGGIALALTSISGSSDYVVGGIVAYSNTVKETLLDVSRDTIDSVGAVSAECAREMASGVRRRLGAHVGIASTGIAGPGGATRRKPVGLVYIAVSTPHAEQVRELRLSGDRRTIMQDATRQALELALTNVGAPAPETE